MPVHNSADELVGVKVACLDGHRLGEVDHINLNDRTIEPEWAAVPTGLFGAHVCLVPVSALDWTAVGSTLVVSATAQQVRDAPHHDPSGPITPDQEGELAAYYGRGDLTGAGSVVTANAPDFDHLRRRPS